MNPSLALERAGIGVYLAQVESDRPERSFVLDVGAIVDDFELLDQQGQPVTLTGLLSSGPLVLYFFVKAKTPG
jgi:cytochrome oxidase Cu insertion factor (SCO1/SenC/PrrC family)